MESRSRDMYSIHRSCYIEVENIHMTHDMVLWYFPTRTFSKWFRANSILLLARACPFAVLCHVCSALSALCSAIFNLQIASIRSNDSIRSPHRRRERESKGRKGGGGNPLHKMAAMAAVSQQKFGTKDSDEGGEERGLEVCRQE